MYLHSMNSNDFIVPVAHFVLVPVFIDYGSIVSIFFVVERGIGAVGWTNLKSIRTT